MSWGKVPHGPPPLLGGAGKHLGHDGVSAKARENLRRIKNDEDLPPSMRDKPTPTPTPRDLPPNKRKKQIDEQEQGAESPDNPRDIGSDGKNWIAGATKNKGGLHRSLGVPEGKKIPKGKIATAAQKGGKVGKQAQLAETLEGFDGKCALGHDGCLGHDAPPPIPGPPPMAPGGGLPRPRGPKPMAPGNARAPKV